MNGRHAGIFAFGLAALAVASGAAPRAQRSGGTLAATWLDAPLANWNRHGRGLPKPPAPQGDRPDAPRCGHLVRPATGAEDRAVLEAGWTPFGALQVAADVTLVRAASGVDGMCRPLGYQVFTYVGGQLAGTLSPVPMSARSDGAAGEIEADGGERLRVTFARYVKDDPLCCPSRHDVVVYRVERGPAGPLVVPVEVLRRAKP